MYGRSSNTRSFGPSKRSGFGGRSFGGSRSNFSRGRGGSFGRNKIDISQFINRAAQKKGEEKPYIVRNKFADFNIDPRLKQNILKKGYSDPTPIQDQSIPHLLAGKDLVGVANTGTGKTAAFLIPLINKVLQDRSQKVIIITPTRELAFQIEDEFRGFSQGLSMYSVACFGGANIGRQISSLRRDHNFVIGTPGRLKDLIERRVLDLGRFRNVVLDEVDRMFDIGFFQDIKHLLSFLPKERHSLFFSATVSGKVEGVIREFLVNPVTVSVKTGETADNVEQEVVKVNGYFEKIETLHSMLIKEEFKKVLIFGKTKIGVEKLSRTLYAKGFKVESIHGDKTQHRRQKALNLFKMDRVDILVATDVAARGLDISDVTHVINFDLPDTYDDYIHRIGRTGRANKKGQAVTFVE